MNKCVFLFLILLLTVTGSHIFCTTDFSGAGSETTNEEGICGIARHGDGSAAVASVVKLIPSDFNSSGKETISDVLIDTTDSNGTYLFSDIAIGTYNIIIRDEATGTGSKIDDISYSKADTQVQVPETSLTPMGSIKITLDDFSSNKETTVFIPGTDIKISATDAEVLIINVPAGEFSPMYVVTDSETPVRIYTAVTIEAEKTLTIHKPFWQHSTEIFINTTVSGVPLGTTLYNIPVMIRLSADNFPFEEAMDNGSDFRLTKTDNTDIPFEIAVWDKINVEAVIWMLIDTLFPDTVLELTTYWGNESAESVSSSTAVFDTSFYFQGVWHLEQENSDTVSDATCNNYDGVRMNSSSVPFSKGIAGNGCSFNGSDGYIQMFGTADSRLSFPEQGSYTVSAWVYIEEADNNSHVVLSKGNYQYFLFYTSIHSDMPLWEFSEYQSGSGWDLSTTEVRGGSWHYLTGIRNGSNQYLHIDGVLSDSANFTYGATKENDTGFDLTLGRFLQDFGGNDFCFFEGIIDEVRICSTVRSSDWIRISYENQKPENKLVTFIQP